MAPDNFLIGQRILNARVKAGLSQKELSRETGLSQPNISLYEHGKQKPTVTALYCISKVCNVSCDYLLGLSDEIAELPSISKSDDNFVVYKLLERGEFRIVDDGSSISLVADKDRGNSNAVEYLTLLKKTK